MRQEDQERGIVEVQSRIVSSYLQKQVSLQEILATSIFFEKKRLHDEPAGKAKDADSTFWKHVYRQLNRASEHELKDLFAEATKRYLQEIIGHFDPRVYQFATKLLPTGLGLLLNAVSPKKLLQRFPSRPKLEESIIVQGETKQLRRLHELGTVLLVPTHVSNIDSIAVGYAIYRLGLPPFVYGAGLNLFTNPLISFFMRNLGAYTVDRRKQDPLYKDVLKEYATLTLEWGYDNIFFPGGTRARSGALERRPKLGLLGTGLRAYINNLLKKSPSQKLFIVPATISCQLVLEAETLIDDFLKEVGKARYIISDDEFSEPSKIFDFATKLLSLDSKIHMTISRGLDPFGNEVDENGESLDPHGRHIEISGYVRNLAGDIVHDENRDAEYTREVGERICEAYARDNVAQTTNVTAKAVFDLFRTKNQGIDLLRLIRVGPREEDLELRQVYEEVDRQLVILRKLSAQSKIRLGPTVDHGSAEDVVAQALRHFAVYHTNPAVQRRGDRITSEDRSLLLYYQNRLEGYQLERAHGLGPALTTDHRALAGGAIKLQTAERS